MLSNLESQGNASYSDFFANPHWNVMWCGGWTGQHVQKRVSGACGGWRLESCRLSVPVLEKFLIIRNS